MKKEKRYIYIQIMIELISNCALKFGRLIKRGLHINYNCQYSGLKYY